MLDNNNVCPSLSYKTECGINIGIWIDTQRQNKKKNKLSQDKITVLHL
mgnify:CR=1 FL=1